MSPIADTKVFRSAHQARRPQGRPVGRARVWAAAVPADAAVHEHARVGPVESQLGDGRADAQGVVREPAVPRHRDGYFDIDGFST